MAINYFIGWSVVDLETELRAAQEDLAAGKTGIAAGAGDVRSQSEIQKSAESRIEMILRALHLKEPDKYPLAEISRITQTRAAFS